MRTLGSVQRPPAPAEQLRQAFDQRVDGVAAPAAATGADRQGRLPPTAELAAGRVGMV